MNPIKDLQEYLKTTNIRQASIKLGVTRQTIYNWLKGGDMTVKHWQKILNVLNNPK